MLHLAAVADRTNA